MKFLLCPELSVNKLLTMIARKSDQFAFCKKKVLSFTMRSLIASIAP
jgi:hypothetical protein